MKSRLFFIIKIMLFFINCIILSFLWPFILVFCRNGTANKIYARFLHYLFKHSFLTDLVYINLNDFDKNKNYILVCNHQSFFDPVIAGKVFLENCYVIAKNSLKYTPYFGMLYHFSGNFYINRGDSKKAQLTLAKIVERVKLKKSSIFIFPQGTRCHDNKITKLKRGFIQLAKATETDILPLVISSYRLSEILTHFKLKKPIYLKICDTIDYRKPEEEILEMLKNLMQNTIAELDSL